MDERAGRAGREAAVAARSHLEIVMQIHDNEQVMMLTPPPPPPTRASFAHHDTLSHREVWRGGGWYRRPQAMTRSRGGGRGGVMGIGDGKTTLGCTLKFGSLSRPSQVYECTQEL